MITEKFKIIDAHVHIGRGEIQNDCLMSNISPDSILRLMSESGVDRSIIFAPYCPSGYAEANKEITEYISKNPLKFIGFGRIRSQPVSHSVQPLWRRGVRKLSRMLPERGLKPYGVRRLSKLLQENTSKLNNDCREEILRCLEQYKFSGIKIHPAQDGLPSQAVFSLLHEYRKPILFHCGTGINLRLIEEDIIKRYAMPIILAHMGGYPADRRLYVEAIALAQKYPHVYLDTAYVFFQYILEVAATTCPSKIIFGSDAPGIHPDTSISCILSLRVSENIKQMIFSENIKRIVEI